MDHQQISKFMIETIIKECNEVLYRWTEAKRDFLVTETEVRGVLFNRLKGYAGNWRQQKMLLKALRIQIVDGQINSITTNNYYDNDGTIEIFENYFSKIDFTSLKLTILSNLSINTINFKTIENIKF